jgi:hypothetical protein
LYVRAGGFDELIAFLDSDDTWEPEKLDHVSHGLYAYARRNLHRMPGAIRRSSLTARKRRFFAPLRGSATFLAFASGTAFAARVSPRPSSPEYPI